MGTEGLQDRQDDDQGEPPKEIVNGFLPAVLDRQLCLFSSIPSNLNQVHFPSFALEGMAFLFQNN